MLGIYAAGSWVVLQIVDTMAGALGLPEWAPSLALFLLIIGLPIVLATAFLQEGLSTKEPEVPQQSLADVGDAEPDPPLATGAVGFFTWKNALGGGVVALAVWGLIALGWVFLGGAGPEGLAPTTANANPSQALLPQGEERAKSIAVLPFANLSPDAENAFFADGVHESVLTQISKIGDLRVLSRASMLRYRETDLSLAEIADELAVGAILQGSVQRAGGQIRISAQLVDPVTEENLWADQYDGSVEEIFDFQSDVALRVAAQLEATLNPREVEAVTRRATESVNALDFYLRGSQAYNRFREADNEEAIRLFRQAIAEDSSFAIAWASLGDGYLQRVQFYGYPMAWADSAEAAARRAIALDSTSAEGYKTLGFAQSQRGYNGAATEFYERAYQLNPNFSAPANNLGVAYWLTGGDWAEANRWFKRSFQIEPNGGFARENVALSYGLMGESEIAEHWIEEAQALDPASPSVRRQRMALAIFRREPETAYKDFRRFLDESEQESGRLSTVAAVGAHYAGQHADVLDWTARALEQSSGGALADIHDIRVLRAHALSREDLSSEAVELLADAEREFQGQVDDGADNSEVMWWLSSIHMIRGSHDAGLDWLERSIDGGFNWWFLIEQDPIFDEVRGEPRYQAAIATMQARVEASRLEIEAEERAAGERP